MTSFALFLKFLNVVILIFFYYFFYYFGLYGEVTDIIWIFYYGKDETVDSIMVIDIMVGCDMMNKSTLVIMRSDQIYIFCVLLMCFYDLFHDWINGNNCDINRWFFTINGWFFGNKKNENIINIMVMAIMVGYDIIINGLLITMRSDHLYIFCVLLIDYYDLYYNWINGNNCDIDECFSMMNGWFFGIKKNEDINNIMVIAIMVGYDIMINGLLIIMRSDHYYNFCVLLMDYYDLYYNWINGNNYGIKWLQLISIFVFVFVCVFVFLFCTFYLLFFMFYFIFHTNIK